MLRRAKKSTIHKQRLAQLNCSIFSTKCPTHWFIVNTQHSLSKWNFMPSNCAYNLLLVGTYLFSLLWDCFFVNPMIKCAWRGAFFTCIVNQLSCHKHENGGLMSVICQTSIFHLIIAPDSKPNPVNSNQTPQECAEILFEFQRHFSWT